MAAVRLLGLTVLCTIAALVLPVAAGANVYCVDATPGTGDNNSIDPSCNAPIATIATALTTAQANGGADSVLVGPAITRCPTRSPTSSVTTTRPRPTN